MSLLKQKKEHDRIAAELAAKAKEEAILRELAIHPVVKAGCDRDVCDAYFHGLVFAAIADDEKVDADERAILDGIAKSMSLGEGEIEDAITSITKMSVDDKLLLIEECVCAIKGHEPIIKLFYSQFVELWMTGEYNLGELKEYVGMFKEWSGVELPSSQMKNIKAVVSNSAELDSALDYLATWMGNDVLKYFALHRYGNVTSRIEKSQKDKRAAEKKRQAEAKRRAEEEDRIKERAAFDAWLEAIAEQYGATSTIPKGVPAELSRNANEFDVGKLDFDEIKQKILSGLETYNENKSYSTTQNFRLRMAWMLLGYFALRFELDDECTQVRSVKYLMKKSCEFFWFGSGTIVQSFKNCIKKYEV